MSQKTNTDLPDQPLREPSEEFKRAFDEHVSGCVRDCSCGRVFFDNGNSGYSWEEGELEGLEEKALKNPDKYQARDYGIGCYRYCGRLVVWDCVCEYSTGAANFELLLQDQGAQIADYLNARAKRLREVADSVTIKDSEALR